MSLNDPSRNQPALRRRPFLLVRALAALVASSLVAANSAGAAVRPAGIDVGAGVLGARTTEAEAASGSRLFLEKDGAGHRDSVHLYAGFANDPVNLRDPTGEAINLAAAGTGAVVGYLLGGGLEFGRQLLFEDEFDIYRISGSAVGGAAAGAFIGLTAGVGTPLAGEVYLAAMAGVVGGSTTRAMLGEEVTPGTMAVDALSSAATFGVMKGGFALHSNLTSYGFVDDAVESAFRSYAREASRGARVPEASTNSSGAGPTREAILSTLGSAIGRRLSDIRQLVPDARIGVRGSLARGTKGSQKNYAPFDPQNFDIDLFVASDSLRRGRGFQIAPKPFREIARQLGAEIRGLPEFQGLREPPVFRVFGERELQRKALAGDPQYFFIEW